MTTASACRASILAYTDQIRQTLAAKEPTLAEIDEIQGHCTMIARDARFWRRAESLIGAADHTASIPLENHGLDPLRDIVNAFFRGANGRAS